MIPASHAATMTLKANFTQADRDRLEIRLNDTIVEQASKGAFHSRLLVETQKEAEFVRCLLQDNGYALTVFDKDLDVRFSWAPRNLPS